MRHPPTVGHLYREYGTADMTPQHTHPIGQFCYVWQGSAILRINDHSQLLIPRQGFWIPAGCAHGIYALRTSVLTYIYLNSRRGMPLPPGPVTLLMDPLSTGLLVALRDIEDAPQRSDERKRLLEVLRDRLVQLQYSEGITVGEIDQRLRPIVLAVFDEPKRCHTLKGWARRVGATERNLARLFRHTFGMSFLHWRQRILMGEALRRLQAGEPVTAVALDVGYATPSAFSYAFRSAIGFAPSRYSLTASMCETRGPDLRQGPAQDGKVRRKERSSHL